MQRSRKVGIKVFIVQGQSPEVNDVQAMGGVDEIDGQANMRKENGEPVKI